MPSARFWSRWREAGDAAGVRGAPRRGRGRLLRSLLDASRGPAQGPRAPSASAPLPAPSSDSDAVVDRVICVINSDAITLYELDEAEAFYLYENKMQPPPDEERTALREKVLNSIVEKRLQLQQAEKEKLTVEDSEM